MLTPRDRASTGSTINGAPCGSAEGILNGAAPTRLSRTFAFIIAKRWYVLAVYVLLLLPSAYFAARVGQDNSLDRLIVPNDPD